MSYREDWFEFERLHRAAAEGNVREIQRLVEAGYDINAFDDMSMAPLHYAVKGEHYQAAKCLLDHGALVNQYDEKNIGETALCYAVQRDYPEIVELLMSHGADPDINGWVGVTAAIRAHRRTDADGIKIRAILDRYRERK